jgi:hypothetical protein
MYSKGVGLINKTKHEGKGSERVFANKSLATDRSYGAQVQARTRSYQGGNCCMNFVIEVLLCTIGKKEGISGGICMAKGVPELVGESR